MTRTAGELHAIAERAATELQGQADELAWSGDLAGAATLERVAELYRREAIELGSLPAAQQVPVF